MLNSASSESDESEYSSSELLSILSSMYKALTRLTSSCAVNANIFASFARRLTSRYISRYTSFGFFNETLFSSFSGIFILASCNILVSSKDSSLFVDFSSVPSFIAKSFNVSEIGFFDASSVSVFTIAFSLVEAVFSLVEAISIFSAVSTVSLLLSCSSLSFPVTSSVLLFIAVSYTHLTLPTN